MSTPSLTDFLLARIAEDEADAESIKDFAGAEGYYGTKTLAECEAKRRIVEMCKYADDTAPDYKASQFEPGDSLASDALRIIALPYADHPDYRPEWRP